MTKFYDIPDNLPDWIKLIPTENFGGSTARIVFKDTRTGAEISTYYDTTNALGIVTDKDWNPIPYFEAYPIEEKNFRFYASEQAEMYAEIIKEFERLHKGEPNQWWRFVNLRGKL